jgi:hypothetical protein
MGDQMIVEPIGVIAFALGMIGLFAESSFIVYVFFGATLLGAAAAVILNNLGGTTVQPAHLLLGFLTAKLLRSRGVRIGALRAVAVGSPGLWLVITTVYAAIAAYVMPRLFLGQTLAFGTRGALGAIYAEPLAPVTSNLTQSIYLVGNCVCFVVLSGFGSSEAGRKCLGRAALTCVILNLFFAALDLVTYATNTADLMSFIRNSTYGVQSGQVAIGLKRIVGSFVEASSFSYCTLGYFAFAISLWFNGVAPRLTLLLSALSFVVLLFSTSTTAYVGLTVYLFFQFIVIVLKFIFQPIRLQMIVFLIGSPIALALVIVMICLSDASYVYVEHLLDFFVLNKMSSSSGIERTSWNTQAIQNFLDTYGLGVGNGSVRASSFPIALLASLGFLGSATHALFLLKIWLRRRMPALPAIAAMQTAARSACLAWLIAATVSGGFIDLGLPFFAIAALGCADSLGSRRSFLTAKVAPVDKHDGYVAQITRFGPRQAAS